MNEDIYQHFAGYELFVKQLLQAKGRYERYPVNIGFDFMTLDKMNIVSKVLGNSVPYQFIGGYEDALKKMLVIGEDIDPSDYICALKSKFNPHFNSLTHRDVTGALYSLQIEMEKFGDVWVDQDYVYIYCSRTVSQSVCDCLTSIGRSPIHFEECDTFPSQQFKFRESTINVSSMRLDVVLSHIIHKSREKSQQMIRNKCINVNFMTIEECDYLCNNYDILSVKGTGRFIVGQQITVTKSGNIVLQIKQFV